MKTSKKEKKFVVVYKRWGNEQEHTYKCVAESAKKAEQVFQSVWKDHEDRAGHFLPCDILKVKEI